MKKRNNYFFGSLFFAVSMIAGHLLWQNFRPVKIVAVHYDNSGFSDVLVKSFPLTDKGKIKWWLKNNHMLKSKYNIPQPSSDESFNVTFWLFGEGYKEEGKYDRLCFDDMKGPINCIEKDAVFAVNNDRDKKIHFTTYGGHYLLRDDGKVEKYEYHFDIF